MTVTSQMNERQREAMEWTEGPELILAGAGSGKTRVLTHRIAYLIREKQVSPWNILAITFTNKAAAEMRSRVDALVESGAEAIWVATFHSSCVRILRRFIDRIGYDNHFTIYDADDQKAAMREVLKQLQIDPKSLRERAVLSAISTAKNEMVDSVRFESEATDFQTARIARCYRAYQDLLRKNNALDFDDLLFKTVQLFEADTDVLAYYQERFRYIMVDEYQDTNSVQFRLIELLAKKYRNLCVVGDDDQSIYKFRGANIHNILNFEKAFPGAKVVKLEQNYRSSGNILEAANGVIQNNAGRKEKRLWTAAESGEKVQLRRYASAAEEAEEIAAEIKTRAVGGDYGRFAVLYRTNAQSRVLEERFVAAGIPYRLVGGVNFYQRREIKDILAYLKTVANAADDLAVQRILNVPKRGIGAATVTAVSAFAAERDLGFFEALREAPAAGVAGRAGEKIQRFVNLIGEFRMAAESCSIADLIRLVLDKSGYLEALKEEGEVEAQSRLENIDELISKAVDFARDTSDLSDRADGELPPDMPLLDRFLEEVALVADIDRTEEGERVTLMTLHAAKGLEFDEVYISGMEEGLFPGNRSIGDDEEMEEERRLCYVGITRAKKRLTLSSAKSRVVNGELRFHPESSFLAEIPREVLAEERSANSRDNLRAEKEPRRTDALFTETKPAAFGKVFQVERMKTLPYEVGDRVRHARFGEGSVTEIKDGKKDYEVTVDFDELGVRKMLACFAKLEKITS
nr:UvrD-helicase domain-containing protein [uncultured Stomatobaculum sp.]